jgi:polysaccharide export outer membrane protein
MSRLTKKSVFAGNWLWLLACFLTACAPVVKNPTPINDVESAASSYPIHEYRIQPGDQLDIKFFYNPELNELLIPVRPDGRISLQLIGELRAAEMTPAELAAELQEKYSVELKRPEVVVIVRSFGGRVVFVDGEVNRAGLVNLLTPMTILQSIAQAGGLRETAWRSEIIVIRRGTDNKAIVHTVNLKKALDGTDVSQDLFLWPYDIVYVPKSPISNVNQWVDQYVRKNIPIPIGISLGSYVLQ